MPLTGLARDYRPRSPHWRSRRSAKTPSHSALVRDTQLNEENQEIVQAAVPVGGGGPLEAAAHHDPLDDGRRVQAQGEEDWTGGVNGYSHLLFGLRVDKKGLKRSSEPTFLPTSGQGQDGESLVIIRQR